ncbi:TNF receptor-associated factor 3-like [Dendronephthya gigantea]|uniref:TNF receptor-associated factor 3-like n=1 Tax=Dendronephthya gigantea TaxID=151771 RepID=UPI00106ADE69|nr:TNF receptor-associated factor 3-like [Dendronephthya gigantea]
MASSVVQGAGFDENRFDGPVSDNFKCTICFNVLNDPKSCQKNQHYFCNACIHQYVQDYSQTCPECRQELTVETLVTPPRILLNCISELRIKCDHVKRGCADRIQLGKLKNHLEECGFAPVTCANDGCDAVVNKRDRIHHETELCEFRRVQCHNCEELRNEVSRLSENLSKTTAERQAKLEGKLDQVTTRLQNIEGSVYAFNIAQSSENARLVQEIFEIKDVMNDMLYKLSNINNVVCQIQASEKQKKQKNDEEDAQVEDMTVTTLKQRWNEPKEEKKVVEKKTQELRSNDTCNEYKSLGESSEGTTKESMKPPLYPKMQEFCERESLSENDESDGESSSVKCDESLTASGRTAYNKEEKTLMENKTDDSDDRQGSTDTGAMHSNNIGCQQNPEDYILEDFNPNHFACFEGSSTPRKGSLSAPPSNGEGVKLGTKVLVWLKKGYRSTGIVRYVGTLPPPISKICVGVELFFGGTF